MSHRLSVAAVLVGALLVACSRGPGGPPPAATSPPQNQVGPTREFQIDLHELGDSGVTGTVRLETTRGGEGSRVIVELDGAPDGPLIGHMHSGPCTEKSSTPTHTFGPIEDGRLDTTISASVQGLTHGNFSLAVHADDDGKSTHIACGQISGPPSDE